METRRPMDVEPDAVPVPVPDGEPDAVVGAAVAGMDPGWTLLRGRMLDGGARHPPARLRYVLLHPRIGVALLEVAPDLTPEASARLRRRLDAARFGAVFPGHLPIVHRSLPAERLGLLGELLERAFAMEQPISLPGGEAWPAMVGRVLPAAAPAAPATRRRRASVSARDAAGWRLLSGFCGVLALALGGGAAVLQYLGPPGAPAAGAAHGPGGPSPSAGPAPRGRGGGPAGVAGPSPAVPPPPAAFPDTPALPHPVPPRDVADAPGRDPPAGGPGPPPEPAVFPQDAMDTLALVLGSTGGSPAEASAAAARRAAAEASGLLGRGIRRPEHDRAADAAALRDGSGEAADGEAAGGGSGPPRDPPLLPGGVPPRGGAPATGRWAGEAPGALVAAGAPGPVSPPAPTPGPPAAAGQTARTPPAGVAGGGRRPGRAGPGGRTGRAVPSPPAPPAAGAGPAIAPASDQRCRAVLVRAQLEEVSDADRSYLRGGCRARD